MCKQLAKIIEKKENSKKMEQKFTKFKVGNDKSLDEKNKEISKLKEDIANLKSLLSTA